MKKTDRYVLRGFFIPFLLCLLFLIFLMHVAVLFDRLNYFASAKAPLHRLLLYFLYRTPYVLCQIMPVAALFSSVFSLAEMARNNETLAVFSAGTSFARLAAPLFAAGLLLTGFTMVFNDQIVPLSAQQETLIASNLSGKQPAGPRTGTVHNIRKFGGENSVFFANRYVHLQRTLYGLVVVIRDPLSGALIGRVDAERAVWNEDRAVWVLTNVRSGIFVSNRLVRIEESERKEYDFGERPEDFRREDKAVKDMSIAETAAFVRWLKRSGSPSARAEVELHWKFSYPFGILMMILIGAPLAGFSRKNILISSFFFSFIVTLIYYLLIMIGFTLGKNEVLPPLLAAWAGNIIFIVPVIWLFRKTRT